MEIGQKPINRTLEKQVTLIKIMEYCSAIKGNILLMHAVTSKKLKSTMLSLKSYRKRVLDDYLNEKFRNIYILSMVSVGQGLIREKRRRKSSGM